MFELSNVGSGKSEIKRKLSAGRNCIVTGSNFLLAGCGSDPYKFIQERLPDIKENEIRFQLHDLVIGCC